jgi:hypothetical protein
MRLLDFGGQYKESAKALLRDIRSRTQQAVADAGGLGPPPTSASARV